MQLSAKEVNLIFRIMQDLSGELSYDQVRWRVGEKFLDLLQADYFASFVWDAAAKCFVSGISINMSEQNLERYDEYYQYHDPITLTLQKRQRATAVSRIMSHARLQRTEFFNDFLARDGLFYGLNYFAYDNGANIGDVRIWRREGKADFCQRDEAIIDYIGPSLVNALARAKSREYQQATQRQELRQRFGLTRREAEVADLLAAGLSDEGICLSLGCAKPTLRSHISAIFHKTQTARRGQIAGLVSPGYAAVPPAG